MRTKRWDRRSVLARAAAAGTGAAAAIMSPPAVSALAAAHAAAAPDELAPDWDVPGGHFYTQGVGAGFLSEHAAYSASDTRGSETDRASTAGDDADHGFSILDTDGMPFWNRYQALGGPAQLGFPVSLRFEWHGGQYQTTEAALLGQLDGTPPIDVAPVFAHLAELDLDDWLLSRGVPLTSTHLREAPSLSASARLEWLTHPLLRGAFAAVDEAAGTCRFGLPMGEPERFGPYLAQRFDKAVMQLWLDEVPGQPRPGTVTLVQVGALLHESGLVPRDIFLPQAPPAPRPPMLPAKARSATPQMALSAGKHLVVSIAQQWWYAYQDARLLFDGPVTTGQPALFTPTGDFTILSRHSPFTFVSPWPPGSPYYYEPSPTTYALRITDSGIFLHDAPWRPYYGPGTNVPHVDPDGV